MNKSISIEELNKIKEHYPNLVNQYNRAVKQNVDLQIELNLYKSVTEIIEHIPELLNKLRKGG